MRVILMIVFALFGTAGSASVYQSLNPDPYGPNYDAAKAQILRLFPGDCNICHPTGRLNLSTVDNWYTAIVDYTFDSDVGNGTNYLEFIGLLYDPIYTILDGPGYTNPGYTSLLLQPAGSPSIGWQLGGRDDGLGGLVSFWDSLTPWTGGKFLRIDHAFYGSEFRVSARFEFQDRSISHYTLDLWNPTVPVPLPTSSLFLVTGLFGTFFVARRKKGAQLGV